MPNTTHEPRMQDRPATPAEPVEAEARPCLEPEEDRVAQQALLEMEALASARALFDETNAKARAEGREMATAFGAGRLGRETEALARAIGAWLEEQKAGKPGRPPLAAALIARVEPGVAAAITLRRLIDRLTQTQSLAAAAAAIGAAIEDEARLRRLRERDAPLFSTLRARAKGGTSSRGAAQALRAALAESRRAPEAGPRWSLQERELVGLRLIDLARETTGLFEVIDARQGRRRSKRLAPSEAAIAALAASDARADGLRPLYEPMVCAPRPWSDLWDGGYLTNHLPRQPLVKTRRLGAVKGLTTERAPEVFSAINAAQATAWTVNGAILQTVEDLESCGRTAPGLPAARPGPPPAPTGDDAADRRERGRHRAEEAARRSRRTAFELARATAARFRAFDRLWFPAQCDFRGRLYFAPAVNPQGSDLTRALFRFAEGKPLGEEGWKWLAIHLCNCGDFGKMSKAPLAARVEWTLDNEDRILTVAADPLADDWWMEADAPWQFLAACFEWAGFCAEDAGFVSHLPIALDGSCSGLQHFSLALRDEVGGRAVNLVAPRDAAPTRAADIYAEVAERTTAMLRADAETPEEEAPDAERAELARRWLRFGVDRAVAKRPTMTYGYGARRYGFARMIVEDTLAPAQSDWLARGAPENDDRWPFEDRVFPAALYLAARLTEAIEQAVLKAADAMRWLQEAASLAAAEGRALSWTTPDGFPVSQHYPDTRERRVKTAFGRTLVRLTLREETGALDKRRQRQGAAPNFVHSLDGCHLRMTVNRAQAEGMRSFALVHDSFGVHAADSPRFFQIIREAMVAMYEGVDVMARFRGEIAEQISPDARDRLSETPHPGPLDITDVLESEFCFA